MKKINKYSVIGMVIISFLLIANSQIVLPDFIYGIGLGIGLAFMITGLIMTNYDVSKLKGFKKKIFNKNK